jgi:hypothetical protein
MNIRITAKKVLWASVHRTGESKLQAGESATITKAVVAHPTNPLYEVTKADGKQFVVYRDDLVECGALDRIPE